MTENEKLLSDMTAEEKRAWFQEGRESVFQATPSDILNNPAYQASGEEKFGDSALYKLSDHGLSSDDVRGLQNQFWQSRSSEIPEGGWGSLQGEWSNYLSKAMEQSAREKAGFGSDLLYEKAKRIQAMTQKGHEMSPWEQNLRNRYANTIREAYGRASRAGGDRASQARGIGGAAAVAVPRLEQYIAAERETERNMARESLEGIKIAAESQAENKAIAVANQLMDYQTGQEERDAAEMTALLSMLGTGLGAVAGGLASSGNPAGIAAGASLGGSLGSYAGQQLT